MDSGSYPKPNDAPIHVTAYKQVLLLTCNLVVILPGFGNMTLVNTLHRPPVYDGAELT